jgi:hypothetical protein
MIDTAAERDVRRYSGGRGCAKKQRHENLSRRPHSGAKSCGPFRASISRPGSDCRKPDQRHHSARRSPDQAAGPDARTVMPRLQERALAQQRRTTHGERSDAARCRIYIAPCRMRPAGMSESQAAKMTYGNRDCCILAALLAAITMIARNISPNSAKAEAGEPLCRVKRHIGAQDPESGPGYFQAPARQLTPSAGRNVLFRPS